MKHRRTEPVRLTKGHIYALIICFTVIMISIIGAYK
jgi:hypothetical protein